MTTRNFVPRNDNEGKIGIPEKKWSNVFTTQLTQQSTLALESAPLGDELLTSSGWMVPGLSWTGGFATGFTHAPGNTSKLSNDIAAVIGDTYQVSYTVTNRTDGFFFYWFRR